MVEGSRADEDIYDMAVIGGGPAGLMAALKSALLFHSCVVLDKGKRTSRAFFVPKMANIPGYPAGVSGRTLMDDLRTQIREVERVAKETFVTFPDPVEITGLARDEDGLYTLTGHEVEGRDGIGERVTFRARVVILATGVVDRQPYIGEKDYDISAILPYANKGIADYCLLCDGHTIRDKSVAVIGIDGSAMGIAHTLLTHFKASAVSLVTCIACVTGEGGHDHDAHIPLLDKARERGLGVVDKKIARLEGLKEDRIRIVFEDDSVADFDKAWISFGWFKVNNDLAVQVGGAVDREGYVRSTEDCEVIDAGGSPIPGFFVVGDLRAETWNQVPIAMGDAETAVVHAYAIRL